MIDYILVKNGKYLVRERERDMGASYWAHLYVDDAHLATGYKTAKEAAAIAGIGFNEYRTWKVKAEAFAEGATVMARNIICDVKECYEVPEVEQ